jgi:FixJ family two-component response regulator
MFDVPPRGTAARVPETTRENYVLDYVRPGARRVGRGQRRAGPLLIRDALAKLSPQHRAVIARSFYLEWTTAQIADDLRIPEGTVKSGLHICTAGAPAHTAETGVRYDAEVVTAARLGTGRGFCERHFG